MEVPLYQLTEDEVLDAARFRAARADAALSVAERYGGRLLAISLGSLELVEGDKHPPMLILQHWPSRQGFDQFYQSADYQPLKEERHRLHGRGFSYSGACRAPQPTEPLPRLVLGFGRGDCVSSQSDRPSAGAHVGLLLTSRSINLLASAGGGGLIDVQDCSESAHPPRHRAHERW